MTDREAIIKMAEILHNVIHITWQTDIDMSFCHWQQLNDYKYELNNIINELKDVKRKEKK